MADRMVEKVAHAQIIARAQLEEVWPGMKLTAVDLRVASAALEACHFGELVEAIQAHLEAVDIEEKDFANTGGQMYAGLTEKSEEDLLAVLQKVEATDA